MINSLAADDQFIEKLNRIIQERLTDSQFGVSELAREMGMGRSNLHRKVSEITGKTVTNLISEARLKKAMEKLKQGTLTVSEVAWDVGFGSVTYFNKCFHDYYGFPPGKATNRDLTEIPQEDTQNQDINTGSHKKKIRIILGVLLLVVLTVVIFVFIRIKPFTENQKKIEKSIAVLPFINDSQDSANVYFINGIMDGILDKLSRINDLDVLARTSVEQYRNNKTKTIPQIAKELGVNYIVEGSGQKYGDKVMLSIQLIEAGSGKHLFSEQYNRKWEDIFSLQSEIATSVANSIKVTITPEEVELIEKKPTNNMTALSLALQGYELAKIGNSENNKDLQRQAGVFFKRAIQLDSTFAAPYVDLGWIVALTSKNYDSALFLANRTLHFDDKNSNAYSLKGWIFLWHSSGMDKEAEDAFKLAIKYNPNNSEGYQQMGELYWKKGNYPLWIEYNLKALQLEKAPYHKWVILTYLCKNLNTLGFYKEVLKFSEGLIEYNNDSLFYYQGKLGLEMILGDYHSAYNTALKWKNRDPNLNPYVLVDICLYLRDYKGALKLLEPLIEIEEKQGNNMNPNSYFGYVYLKNGQKEKSDYHFNGAIRNQLKAIEQNQSKPNGWSYFDLTTLYSAMGEKDKAIENLRKAVKFKDFVFPSENLLYYKNHPIFDTIRDEPEFQEIITRSDDNFFPDREKIEKLLQDYWSKE